MVKEHLCGFSLLQKFFLWLTIPVIHGFFDELYDYVGHSMILIDGKISLAFWGQSTPWQRFSPRFALLEDVLISVQ